MSRIARSYLFVPGNRPDRVPKALAAGADVVIVDLEDAVAPAEKAAAREALAKVLSPGKPVHIRINAADSEWFEDDLALCRRPGVSGVLLPKAEQPEHVREVARRVAAGTAVLPLIETARGYARAAELAAVEGVQRFAFGTIDFQLDLGLEGEEEPLLYFRSGLVLTSRLAGLQPPVEGVTVALDDPEQLRRETLRSKRLGFGGKLCIHPKQVPHVNACFAPTQEEIAWARRVVEAAAASGGDAVAVDGKMVDLPVILRAEQILAQL